MLAELKDFLYRCLYFPLGMFAVLAFGYRVTGRQNVPLTGPVLFIGNHQSYLDIPMMGLASPRRTFFLAKKLLFTNAMLRWLMDFFGTVAVDNVGFSKSGLEGILQELKKGNPVMIYPEGERTWDGHLAPLKPGVSLLIRRARCPIVPIGIAGAYNAWPRTSSFMRIAPPFLPWSSARIAVCVGKPLDGSAIAELERERMLERLTVELQAVISAAERLQRGGQR